MTTREIIQKADSVYIAHVYDDGTALYDLGIGNKTYTIRVFIEAFNAIRDGETK